MNAVCAGRGFAVARRQATISLALLATLAMTCFMTDLLARNRTLEHWLMAKNSEYAERNYTGFSNTGNFIDFEERLLLDELPHADYSHGGVYFFGTSNMKWAFTTWDLPPEQTRGIGNYGIGASNHTTVLRFIRYLIEERQFLRTGPANLVVLGVSFHLGLRDQQNNFFESLLHRRGLFTIAADGRMLPEPMNRIEHWLKIEKARSGGLIWNYGRTLKNWLKERGGPAYHSPHNGQLYRQLWTSIMGDDWQKNMDIQVDRLGETISLLRTQNTQIKIILLPQGTWMDQLPFKARYETLIRALCRATDTPLVDLSSAISDDAFVDSNHLTVEGQRQFRSLIMGELSNHIQNTQNNSVSKMHTTAP